MMSRCVDSLMSRPYSKYHIKKRTYVYIMRASICVMWACVCLFMCTYVCAYWCVHTRFFWNTRSLCDGHADILQVHIFIISNKLQYILQHLAVIKLNRGNENCHLNPNYWKYINGRAGTVNVISRSHDDAKANYPLLQVREYFICIITARLIPRYSWARLKRKRCFRMRATA